MPHNLLETLNVRMVGNGEQIMVLAHGFGTDQSVWRTIVPSFSHDHRIVLFDLACAGSVNYEYFDHRRYNTLDAYVDDLLNILDALGIRSCTYVGHSVSATIGLLASIRRPNIFTKLILIGFSPSVLNDPINNYYGGFQQEEVDATIAVMESNYDVWRRGIAPLLVGADVPEAVQEFSRTLFNMRPDITLFVSRMAFNTDFRGILGLVRVPCSIIQTARDIYVPASVATYVRNHLGGPSTLHLLDTEGHLPHLSAPDLVLQELRRALS